MSLLGKLKARVTAVAAVVGGGAPAVPDKARNARLEAERAAMRNAPAEKQVDLDAVLSGMDKSFFDPSYDSVAPIVASLPEDDDGLDAFIEEQKAAQGVMLSAIQARLSREVMANYAAFIDGMRQISEIDMDVSRASIHVSNSLRKLGGAKASLVTGTLGITYRRRRRERLAEVRDRLQWLRSLVKVDEDMAKACDENRYADAVKLVMEAQGRLRDPAARSYSVMATLKSKLDGALEILRDRVDRGLDAQCVKFDPPVYAAILQAYKQLDDCGVRASSATKAAAAAAAAAASRGERAGTALVDDILGGFDASAGGAGALPGGEEGGDATALPAEGAEGYTPGQSLLAEVGNSLAAVATAASAGMLSIRGISGADSNLAALPSRIQAAAAKAVKSLTKDVVIDLLLREVRSRMEAEGEQAGDDASSGGGSDGDGEGEGEGGEHDTDALLNDVVNLAEEGAAMSGAAKRPRESAAKEYARRRAEMRQRSFSELCAATPAEDIPLAVMRMAAAITHVMHQHYLLLQWHRAPLDPRNNFEEGEYLHRCGADDAETVEEDDPGKQIKRTPSEAAFVDTLKQLRPFLLRGRSVVWQHMQQRFSGFLFSAVSAASVDLPVERLSQCLVLARDLMMVGLEYVGHGVPAEEGGPSDSDPCNTMRGSLRLLCSQYMDSIHMECFEKLKGMLGKELWQRVPLTEASFVSVMENAQAGFKSRFNKQAVAAIQAVTAAILGQDMVLAPLDSSFTEGSPTANVCRAYSDSASLFSHWLDRGNPFGCVEMSEGGRAGATVLPTPRRVIQDDDDDDDEDEEEQADAALLQRRATAKLLRQIHGDGYTLELGVGRGPGLGFGLGLAGEGGAGAKGADSDDDDDDDEEEVVDDATTDSSDEDETGVARARGGGKGVADEDGAFAPATGAASPYAAVFAGDHHHVVTAAALNGFARAVGKYVLLMEVLPTVSTDAFTGLARLFELYLYTVATLFIRPAALRQLFDVAPPTPTYMDKERDAAQYEYVDGTALHIACRVSAAALETREAEIRSSLGSRGAMKRQGSTGSYGLMSPGLDRSFSEDAAGRRGKGDRSDPDQVQLYGVQLHTRGLPAIAQAQGFPADYYTTGAGASMEYASTLVGNSYNVEGVYLTLRRALQQVGADLHSGVRMGTGSTSVLADGHFSADTGVSARGYMPEPYIKLQSSVEVEGEGALFGVVERCVAAESLDFLLDVMARVRTRIEAHTPASHVQSIVNFYTRAVQCCAQVRALTYHCLVPRLLPESGALPNLILQVKWESIKDGMEPSRYSADVQPYIQRAGAALLEKAKAGALPAVSRFGMWCTIVSHIMERFVEGFSRVKKCSVTGRGLMSLDVGTVYAACAKAGPVVPTCLSRDKTFCDAYIAASYYDNEHDLLDWISKNRAAYALRHMRSLLNNGIGPSLKKKAAKDAAVAIDALYLMPPPDTTAVEKGLSVSMAGLTAVGAAFTMGSTV